MTIGVMQPYIFPYIGYFQLIYAVNTYVLFDDVQHIKRGWIHRNNILVNGDSYRFTVSLEGASTTKRINEVFIKDDFSVLEKTIHQNYAKAPYFSEVMDLLKTIFSYEDKNLAHFAANSIQKIVDYLAIDTKIIYASNIKVQDDLRAQDRIISICEKMGATRYVNAIGGQDLYDKDKFAKRGIELSFIKTEDIEYRQFNDTFVPNLSIVDVLMFNSPQRVREMLGNYTLI